MKKIKSNFAILDVLAGSVQYVNEDLKKGPIPVCIMGTIDCAHGRHDGTSKEFSVTVTDVKASE